MTFEIKLEFITPCFSHGATDVPEIRPASIRGMLHHWFRILGGTIEQERTVFGGISFSSHPAWRDAASKIVIRVKDIQGATGEEKALPHKPERGKETSPRRTAYRPRTSFTLLVSDRLSGLQGKEAVLFRDALHAWLLMGTLGFRSTRAGGSYSFQSADFPSPATPEEYQNACLAILEKHGARMKIAVLGQDYNTAESARHDVSDSLGGPKHKQDSDDLARLNNPLGKISGGRKTSPLKYRIVRFGSGYRILALWDGRENVTGNRPSDLHAVIDLLADHRPPKQVGLLLRESSLYQ